VELRILAAVHKTEVVGLTQSAVVKFQQSQGLTALGLVGPLTRAAINKKCAVVVSDNDKSIKEVSSYVMDGGVAYTCSQPIKVRTHANPSYVHADVTPAPIAEFATPVNPDEAKVLCYALGVAVESEGKITVLQKPEVVKMILRYPYSAVSIKAVKFDLIQDKEFVHRLLPSYADKDIGCLIVVPFSGEVCHHGSMNYKVTGGRKLSGTVQTNISKNAAVALLAASLLNRGRRSSSACPGLRR
jgi:hypothetical protein